MLRTALFVLGVVPLALAKPSLNVDNSCGVKGYDLGTHAYYYSADPSEANYDSCGAQCVADSSCKSFAFSDDACLLYRKTVYVFRNKA